MFYEAFAFNQNITGWNTAGCHQLPPAFNQNSGDWDTAAVTSMNGIFYSASDFSQIIAEWDTAAFTDMSEMFAYASAFNQGKEFSTTMDSLGAGNNSNWQLRQ